MIKKLAKKWADRVVKDLCTGSVAARDKHGFYKLLDRKKKELYPAIAATYGFGVFSKLLTLKIINLIAGRYHYINKHSAVASRPLELMIDPSNGCQLHCPGCVHTSNRGWIEESKRHWPAGTLSEGNYQRIMKPYAPFAFAVYLYNYGEPFLNKNTYDYIRLAVSYLTYVTLSSNLSVPGIDPDRIVDSGLNMLIMSIDGVTQKTYEKYRRGGNLDLVLHNVEQIIAAKKRRGSNYPYLIWQFLTFEHNIHEIDSALEKAKQMGVDLFNALTPFDVSQDDPAIRLVQSGKQELTLFTDPMHKYSSLKENQKYLVDEADFSLQWNESLLDRMERIGGMDEAGAANVNLCSWLYQNITMDALGRILPCCTPPADARKLVYGTVNDSGDWFNLPDMQLSRRRGAIKAAGLADDPETSPYCLKCPLSFDPLHSLLRIKQDLPNIDYKSILDPASIKSLVDWNF